MNAIYQSDLSSYRLLKRGKVRDVYDVGNEQLLMIIACDRISAFDCVLPTPIPHKGTLLTQMSNFWFEKTQHIVPNHLVDTDPEWMDWYYEDDWNYDSWRRRVVLVKKAKPLLVEAIVRGYLAGSGWKEYQQHGTVCRIPLPTGLRQSEKLPEPIYTPSTKAAVGEHDENITFEETIGLLGEELAQQVRDISLQLYTYAAANAYERGIIIADTKFEFGLIDGKLVLIDELFTPDSSRFWPVDGYEPGHSPASFDKQYVRDYLESIQWDKSPPAPELPLEVAHRTAEKYQEAYVRLTGASVGWVS
jgi:phosphoribosylaminoimidazole-succinocarboxamide synthase